MIVITGATGQLGRLIVDGLLTHRSEARIGVSVREPEKAADLKQRGVRVAKGDFSEPSSLRVAFDGANRC